MAPGPYPHPLRNLGSWSGSSDSAFSPSATRLRTTSPLLSESSATGQCGHTRCARTNQFVEFRPREATHPSRLFDPKGPAWGTSSMVFVMNISNSRLAHRRPALYYDVAMTSSNDAEMMAEAWSAWQRVPLTEPDGRLARRTQPTSSWTTPSEISLNKGRIYYERGTPNRRKVLGPADVLDNLVRLRPTASDKAVTMFARKWGIVALCAEHGLPLAHSRYFGLGTNETICTLLGGGRALTCPSTGTGSSRNVAIQFSISRRVSTGVFQVIRRTGLAINPAVAQVSDVTIDPRNWKPISYTKTARIDDERENLAELLDHWLELTGVRIRFEWDAASPTFGMVPGGLAGAIVMSLVFAVARSGGLAVCASCGRPYTPTRRPVEGQRSYCPDNDCKKASVRDAQRDMRARRQRQS